MPRQPRDEFDLCWTSPNVITIASSLSGRQEAMDRADHTKEGNKGQGKYPYWF